MRRGAALGQGAMNDHDVRTVLIRRLATRYYRDPETLILEEVGLGNGSARIDVVVINNLLHGFEIKSDRDKLERLSDQMRVYNAVLDRVTLVVGYRWAGDALRSVPVWWGVILARATDTGRIHLSMAREPLDNPAPDPFSIAQLLWREEVLALLDELGASRGVRSKPRAALYSRLVETMGDVDMLRLRVRQQLRHRANWRSDVRQRSGGGSGLLAAT